MGVDLLRGRDVRVAEDGLGIAGRDLQLLEQRCDHTPDLVDGDAPDAVGAADPGEATAITSRRSRPDSEVLLFIISTGVATTSDDIHGNHLWVQPVRPYLDISCTACGTQDRPYSTEILS